MKATYDSTVKTKFNPSHRMERGGLHQEYSALVPDDNPQREMRAIVTLRIYWPASVCYAALWVNGDEVHTSGTGSAGGGGYCKASAAASEAIESAGFTLSKNIHGVGTSAIREAVLALAEAAGYPDARLHVAHA